MNRRRQLLRALALPAAVPLWPWLGGCTLNDAPRRDFQLLRDADAAAAPIRPAQPLEGVLLLDSAAAPTLLDSNRMVYSADGTARAYFQYGQWGERPGRTLLRLAEARLAASGQFRNVALSSSGVRGDLLLTLRLDELYLDDSSRPGVVHLAFSAALIDWRQRRLIARRSFDSQVSARTEDAAGMALAAGQAMGALLGQLVAWAAAGAAPG